MSLTDRASQAIEELMAARKEYSVVNHPRFTEVATSSEQLLYSCTWDVIQRAEPFWWELPISDWVAKAAESLNEWTIRPELLPTPSGFALFAHALRLPVGYSATKNFPLAGFGWKHHPAGTDHNYMQTDSVRLVEFIRLPDGALKTAAWLDLTYGQSISQQSLLLMRASAISQITEAGGDAAAAAYKEGLRTGQLDSTVNPRQFRMTQIVGSAFLFLEQHFAIASKEHPDRIARKRLDKADIVYPELRVVRLRTPKHLTRPDNDPNPVDWQYRWLVRGHWRQQYYRGDDEHRPLWITPYVKGPENKPLKAPTKSVFAVVR